MKPTLLVMAAGMGSRYGGLKQMDSVGPHGETIIDYSIFDALRAGFGKVVFVIRRDIEAAFKANIGARFEGRVAVEYVFQELDSLPSGFTPSRGRTRPWGTGHAILMGAEAVREPFAVINGDDFYGANSFRVLAGHLGSGTRDYAMVGFVLRKTLSEFGSVARGVCRLSPEGFLQRVAEIVGLERDGEDARFTDATGQTQQLAGDELVSMNMWGFTPTMFSHLRLQFAEFLARRGGEEKSEFYIPDVITRLLDGGTERVRVLQTKDSWFGVTYRDDRPRVIERIGALITRGDYPERLWA